MIITSKLPSFWYDCAMKLPMVNQRCNELLDMVTLCLAHMIETGNVYLLLTITITSKVSILNKSQMMLANYTVCGGST